MRCGRSTRLGCLASAGTRQEGTMGLTGKFKFRKTLWGKIVLQIAERHRPLYAEAVERRLTQLGTALNRPAEVAFV